MDEFILKTISGISTPLILLIVGITLLVLGKGADILVDEAISLSVYLRVPKMIIGTTIVSIGTTLPEAAVSVMSAIKGNPELALGNAIGSIIVNTTLIIGIAAMLGKLLVDRKTVNRQGRIQLLAGILLAVAALPIMSKAKGANISQLCGFFFLFLLIIYMISSLKWAKDSNINTEVIKEEKAPVLLQILKFSLGAFLVIMASKFLIPSVEITAVRIGIPQNIIAATLVAFGTSLPELVTAITAVRKGHGELAVGNIIGADILNILFVIGAAAAVTKGGLDVPMSFFRLHIPAMLLVLVIFRFSTEKKHKVISKKYASILFMIYIIYVTISYLL